MSSEDPRLEALETKLAFQENTLQELSDVLIAQQARMDRLESLLRILAERLRDQADDGLDPSDGQPPPHY